MRDGRSSKMEGGVPRDDYAPVNPNQLLRTGTGSLFYDSLIDFAINRREIPRALFRDVIVFQVDLHYLGEDILFEEEYKRSLLE